MPQLKSIDECLKGLDKFAKRHRLGIEAEMIGIDNLREESDILKFVSSYKELSKEVYSEMKDEGDEKIRKLSEAGYSIDDIAEFFTCDSFYFTLGHVYNQKALKAWYPVLEERWRGNDITRFSEMYRIIRN